MLEDFQLIKFESNHVKSFNSTTKVQTLRTAYGRSELATMVARAFFSNSVHAQSETKKLRQNLFKEKNEVYKAVSEHVPAGNLDPRCLRADLRTGNPI